MPIARSPAAIAIALLVLVASPAASQAKLPIVPASPSTGTPATRFTIVVPRRIARRADARADLVALPAHRRGRRCTGAALATPRRRRNGSIVVTLDPSKLDLRRDRWCAGRYRVLITSELIVDDDDETGEGGSFETKLARSSFVVRR